MNNPVYELQQTVFDQCRKCVYFKVYTGSIDPDDPPCVSCGKGEFEYLHPENEWHDKDCELKKVTVQ